MNILIMGLGFVGLTTALGFAEKGHTVYGFDADFQKNNELSTGTLSLSEPGLQKALTRHLDKAFTVVPDPADAGGEFDAVFICVGTPCGEDGGADLRYIYAALDMLEPIIKPEVFKGVIVIKSTVPPAATESKIIPYLRAKGVAAPIANNPEFLREGHCWDDFIQPDRIVCGVENPGAADVLNAIYRGFDAPIVITSLNTAEFIKYLSNTMLASMISFSNEMAMIAQAIGGISVKQAFETLHLDRRWGGASMKHYVYPGCGFGGYCLPKDLPAMIAQAKQHGVTPILLESVQSVNRSMPSYFAERILSGASERVGILGLSFKPGSDDVRDSPAASVISSLLDKQRTPIVAYDPKANSAFAKAYPFPIRYCQSADEVCRSAKTVMIVTAWPEFRGIDKCYPNVRFIDGRYML